MGKKRSTRKVRSEKKQDDERKDEKRAYIRELLEFIGMDELRNYYEMIRDDKILVRGHNHLQVVLAKKSKNFEEWIEFLVEALHPTINPRQKRSTSEIKVRFVDGECTCGYKRVITPVGVLSGSGTPPPFHLCPMGFLTLLTLGRVNKYVVVSDKEINKDSIGIPEKEPRIFVTYTDNEEDIAEGTIVFRKIESSGRYIPLERVF